MFFFIFISTYLFIYLFIINCTMTYKTQTKNPYLTQKKQKVVLGRLLSVKGSAFPVHTLSLEVYLHSFVVNVTPHSV